MLNPSTPLKARRIYDGTVADDVLARWRPVTTGQTSTIKVGFVPSAAHAYALHILRQDLIANPTSYQGQSFPTYHIDRGIDRLAIGHPTRFPRYLYVVGGTTIDGSGDTHALGDALIAAIAPLASLGVTVTFGAADGAMSIGARMHAAIVPVESYSVETFTYGSGPTLDRAVITGEDTNYNGGDVYVACVQGDSSGSGGGWFDTGGGASYAIASGDPAQTLTGYTSIETVAGGRLFVNTTIADYDAAAAVPHQARFRRFEQKYYFPDGPIGSYGFGTDFAGLFAAIASGYSGDSFPAGNVTALAAQIVADAVAFFA